ncbi:E3 ubiquitin-protein ligase RHF2A [Linum perenne]
MTASAAAFVEGGIQDGCEDACSICLEEFSSSDPSTVFTDCRHEYHLQCILEWCQRSSDCPMCLQPVSLKDPLSQELFAGVERERKIRAAAASRNTTTIFRHPTLGDFQLQHLPVGMTDADIEQRIIQHLAAASAAMGRTNVGRRESHRSSRSASSQRHMVLSPHPNGTSSGHSPTSMSRVGHRENEPASINVATPVTPLTSDQSSSASVRPIRSSNERSTSRQSSHPDPDTAGPSDLQSITETLKSRLSSASMRYRDSLSRSTRGWKERLFSRSNSLSEIGTEVRREVNAGIASVSRMMERLDTRDNTRHDAGSRSPSSATHSPDHNGSGNQNGNNSSPAVTAASAST